MGSPSVPRNKNKDSNFQQELQENMFTLNDECKEGKILSENKQGLRNHKMQWPCLKTGSLQKHFIIVQSLWNIKGWETFMAACGFLLQKAFISFSCPQLSSPNRTSSQVECRSHLLHPERDTHTVDMTKFIIISKLNHITLQVERGFEVFHFRGSILGKKYL